MALDYTFRPVDPGNKADIPEEEGVTIADPFLVLRGVITTDDTEAVFDVYTPPISGRLERVYIQPDHNDVPGNAGTLNAYCFQFPVSDAPLINAGGAASYAEVLDLFNALGVGVSNAANTHLQTHDMPGTSHTIFPQLLVQDRLRLRFTNWSDGSAATRRCYIWLYFSAAGAGGASGGGPGPAGDVEFVQLYGTGIIHLVGADPSDTADITLSPVTGHGKIKRIVVTITTPNVGTAYNLDSRTFEIYDVNTVSAPAVDGLNTIFYDDGLPPNPMNPTVNNKLINKSDHMLGEILFRNDAAGQVGVVSVRGTAAGGDLTSLETWTVRIFGESMD